MQLQISIDQCQSRIPEPWIVAPRRPRQLRGKKGPQSCRQQYSAVSSFVVETAQTAGGLLLSRQSNVLAIGLECNGHALRGTDELKQSHRSPIGCC